MKGIDNQRHIAALLDRFLQGTTTVEEEKNLADYLRTATDLPEEWEAYRTMFQYFEQGMEELPSAQPVVAAEFLFAAPVESRSQSHWWLAAAASLLILVGATVTFHFFRQDETPNIETAFVPRQPVKQANQPKQPNPSAYGKDVIHSPTARLNTSSERRTRSAPLLSERQQEKPLVPTNHNQEVSDEDDPVENSSYEDLREAQQIAIHNDVVEAVYELLPNDYNLLQLATDENGVYVIIPTTIVREL
ncbi:MAG: hypothetical protein IKX44_08230 [Prevotella sp.]|nr:hypothetical protein [Prevotella sp.]